MGPRRRHPQPGGDHPNPAAHQPDQRRHRRVARHRPRPHRRRRHRDPQTPCRQPRHAHHPRPPAHTRALGVRMTTPATPSTRPATATSRTEAMMKGRQADSARRRQRVIARSAGVDRTFLYRHRDLLEKIHALEASPPTTSDTTGPAVTRASLQADLLAAHERAVRLNTRVHQLEKRLSEALGEQTWRESGLGPPTDIHSLNQKITHLEQQAIDLRLRLEERDDDLTAARTANRELMAQLNHTSTRR